MTDPKDELGARFDNRRADTDDDEETGQSDASDEVDNTNNTSNANNTSNTSDKPGPDRDAAATRHRQQVPMYLPDKKAEKLNKLYERLDGRSKVAGDGGIEKHADFMVTLVELAVDNEDELVKRLGIEQE